MSVLRNGQEVMSYNRGKNYCSGTSRVLSLYKDFWIYIEIISGVPDNLVSLCKFQIIFVIHFLCAAQFVSL